MKTLTKIVVGVALILLATPVSAKTNTAATIEQMKTNADNSEANHKQYQDNLDIVNKNVEQSDKAVKELKKLKSQLISNTQNVDKNKRALGDMEKEIVGMKTKEQTKMAQDDKQIEDMKKILEKLEANKKKREENLVSYDQMVVQVKEEQKDWDTQVQQMATLQRDLDSKEKKAQDEKNNWLAKRKDYEAEAKKWENQAQNSRDAYNKYKKVQD